LTRLRKYKLLSESEKEREVRAQQGVEAGGWLQVFDGIGDLWREGGTGKDTHLLDRSKLYPDQFHVGIEHCRKKFESTLRKADMLGCGENLKLLHADAFEAIDPLFADSSIDGAFILFPDPWPKARHARRRLLQTTFLDQIARKLQPGATLEIRTDDPDYARQALAALARVASLESMTGQLEWLDHPLDIDQHVETLFEKRFLSKSMPIHHFYLRKTSDVAIT
jgi:tRNA (guanine-N7-)-methyltransferase